MPTDKSRHSKPGARRGRRGRSRRRREATKRQRPGRIRSAGTRVAGHLSPRAPDALGVGLIVLTALRTMGLCLGLAARGVLVVTATPITAVGRGARRLFLGPQVERAGRSLEAAPERRRDRGARVERDEGDDLLPIAPSMPSPDEALIVAEVKQ